MICVEQELPSIFCCISPLHVEISEVPSYVTDSRIGGYCMLWNGIPNEECIKMFGFIFPKISNDKPRLLYGRDSPLEVFISDNLRVSRTDFFVTTSSLASFYKLYYSTYFPDYLMLISKDIDWLPIPQIVVIY